MKIKITNTLLLFCLLASPIFAQENPFIELAPAKDEKPTIDSLSPSRADKRDEKVTIDNQFETGDSFSSGNSKASKNFDMG